MCATLWCRVQRSAKLFLPQQISGTDLQAIAPGFKPERIPRDKAFPQVPECPGFTGERTMDQFNVTSTPAYDAAWKPIWHYKLRAYLGSGTASVIESKETWTTREEAGAACTRVNAGDKSGITFAMYSDD